MKTKTLTCGIRIDDNRSINCGVSITNQSNPMYLLWYDLYRNEFSFSYRTPELNMYYMDNVSAYLTALSDIITAMAEANEFVAVKDEPKQEEKKPYCTDCGCEDLKYLDQYANGEYWKCKDCGKQFIYKLPETK